MSETISKIIQHLQRYSSAQITGAVKTFPLRELLKGHTLLEEKLSRQADDADEEERVDLQEVQARLEKIIIKRCEVAKKLIHKFANTSPEVISLKNSVFALVASRDMLEDARNVCHGRKALSNDLNNASSNVLEAVNIQLQQRFNSTTPQMIAITFPGERLPSYRKLLTNLLTHLDVDSEIFHVYHNILRNVTEGNRVYLTHIKAAKEICRQVFASNPPNVEAVLHSYTLDELRRYETALQATLEILKQDISKRPSLMEFAVQSRYLLDILPEHFTSRKIRMRKTSRVLQLSHYISFLTPEAVSENATASLMLCQGLFEDIRGFLLYQKAHLDVSLNLKSIEDAQKKVNEGLRYREFAIAQLFHEIDKYSSEDLTFVSEKWLSDSNLLLQEVHNLMKDYLQRSADEPQPQIFEVAESLWENIAKLHEAIGITRTLPENKRNQTFEVERGLPNLSKFYDKELVKFIRKSLTTGNTEQLTDDASPEALLDTFSLPLNKIRDYINAFMTDIHLRPAV